jgi:2,3-bisphosphoglycerate-independent phosphoglycerate mutase
VLEALGAGLEVAPEVAHFYAALRPAARAGRTARLGPPAGAQDADEAGHSKRPFAKRDALAALDSGLGRLLELAERAVVCVTGDHATPPTGLVLHSGDPTPLVVAGGAVRPDDVEAFGEAHAARGAYGPLRAADVLPLLLGHADRARLLGHHPTPRDTPAWPDRPEPFTLAPDG